MSGYFGPVSIMIPSYFKLPSHKLAENQIAEDTVYGTIKKNFNNWYQEENESEYRLYNVYRFSGDKMFEVIGKDLLITYDLSMPCGQSDLDYVESELRKVEENLKICARWRIDSRAVNERRDVEVMFKSQLVVAPVAEITAPAVEVAKVVAPAVKVTAPVVEVVEVPEVPEVVKVVEVPEVTAPVAEVTASVIEVVQVVEVPLTVMGVPVATEVIPMSPPPPPPGKTLQAVVEALVDLMPQLHMPEPMVLKSLQSITGLYILAQEEGRQCELLKTLFCQNMVLTLQLMSRGV